MPRWLRWPWTLVPMFIVLGIAVGLARVALNSPASPAAGGQTQSSPSPSGAGRALPAAPPGSEVALAAAHLDLVVRSLPAIDPSGAIGTNRAAWHSIDYQRP